MAKRLNSPSKACPLSTVAPRFKSVGQTVRRRDFMEFWLRDNAQDTRTRDPGNGQRLLSMATSIPVRFLRGLNGMAKRWFELNDDGPLRFDSNWLLARRYDRSRTNRTGWVDEVTLWEVTRERLFLRRLSLAWRRTSKHC